jgi:two-component system, OmpR family, response regulator BaeR
MEQGMTDPSQAPPVLIVEDDTWIADMLANYLHSRDWRTHICTTGPSGVEEARRLGPSVVLLDLNLPGIDGMEVCRRIRGFSSVPIIMITARVDEIDRLIGLEAGADDYVCKPFSPREVAARVKAQWRRASGQFENAPIAGYELNEAAQRILFNGQALDLTASEYRLFRAFLKNPGVLLSRERLLDATHQALRDTSDRTIDSHIRNLRRKLKDVNPEGSGIVAVYGAGYRFEA